MNRNNSDTRLSVSLTAFHLDILLYHIEYIRYPQILAEFLEVCLGSWSSFLRVELPMFPFEMKIEHVVSMKTGEVQIRWV